MRLSDAIMLGSTEFKFDPKWWMAEDCGCLLGLGGHAAGVRYEQDFDKRETQEFDEIQQISNIWPWINDQFPVPQLLKHLPRYDSMLPFSYFEPDACDTETIGAKAIISIMAVHVSLGHITMEQAIDWIRENEPQETEPTPTEAVEIFCNQLVQQ